MKKLALILAGAMMALSLAACAPTEVAKENRPQAAQMNPEGIDPAKIAAENKPAVDPKLTPDPDAVAYETIFVYSVNEDNTGLKRDMLDVEVIDEEAVVAGLIELGVLSEDAVINSWEISGGVKAGPGVDPSLVTDGERIGTLDLSSLEADADKLIVYALGNTFCENFELDKMELLVDGVEYTHSVIADGYLYYVDKYTKID